MKIKLDPLDKLFSRYIRLKAEGKCEYCGKFVGYNRLQCSHFIGRRKRSTRYDPENACALDFSCHTFFQEHPYIHTEFFKKRLGSERFELLNARAEVISKVSKESKEKMKQDLREKIEFLEDNG